MVDEQHLEHAVARLEAFSRWTCTTCPSAAAVAHDGASFGAFSTSTRHMRQTPATGRPGW
jgi:hypothetical protein